MAVEVVEVALTPVRIGGINIMPVVNGGHLRRFRIEVYDESYKVAFTHQFITADGADIPAVIQYFRDLQDKLDAMKSEQTQKK